MIVNFAGYKGGQLVLLEDFVFMQDFSEIPQMYNTSQSYWLLDTYIFSIASEISGQNSSTIVFSLFKANIFSSGRGSSKREMTPAKRQQIFLLQG